MKICYADFGAPGDQQALSLMYPPRAAYARLVLLTFAAGSDVSVVIKHEIQFVLCIFNRHCGLMNLLFVPGIVLTEHKV